MSRECKLIMVTGENNNKFYNMKDNGSVIHVEYGRVDVTCQTASYSSYEWDKIYKSKIKKGYKDVTHLFAEAVITSHAPSAVDFIDISDSLVKSLIAKLEGYTKHTVVTNYKVTADVVTQKQIDEAQSILNFILSVKDNSQLNRYLLELFTVIPRRMKHVQDHLFNERESFSSDNLDKVINSEQEILDAMAQQVKQVSLVKENVSDKKTLLDAMGLEIFKVRPDQENIIKTQLQNLAGNYLQGYRVENKKTRKQFTDFINKRPNKTTKLFFHGSRNENWLPILQTGLILRPTSAVITGKMFGYGTYFADKAQKSWGYTSARGSYWAKGSANEAYMALFEVHTGNPLHVKRHESWCSSLDLNKLKARGDYDSLFAEGGYDLRNNEYITYHEHQSTIKYLVQMKG